MPSQFRARLNRLKAEKSGSAPPDEPQTIQDLFDRYQHFFVTEGPGLLWAEMQRREFAKALETLRMVEDDAVAIVKRIGRKAEIRRGRLEDRDKARLAALHLIVFPMLQRWRAWAEAGQLPDDSAAELREWQGTRMNRRT